MSTKDFLTVTVGNKALWLVAIGAAAFIALVALEIRWPGEVLRVARGLKEILLEPSTASPPGDKNPPPKREAVPSDPDPPKQNKVEVKIEIESKTRLAPTKKKRDQHTAVLHKHNRLKPIEFWRKNMRIFVPPSKCEMLAYSRC